MRQNPAQVTDTARARDFPASAFAFYGVAVVVAIDIALAAAFNHDRGEIGFWIKLVIIFGGLLVWSLWIARRLRKGKGVVAAYSLLGILTGLIGIGALIQITHGYSQPTPFPGMRALSTARVVSGLYLIVWVALIRDSFRGVARPAAG